LLADEVFGETKVTSMIVELRVARESVSALVVTKKHRRGREGEAKFGEKLCEEHGLL
jgi:hypothetical protein